MAKPAPQRRRLDLALVPTLDAIRVVNSAFPEAFAPPDAGLTPQPALVKVTLP